MENLKFPDGFLWGSSTAGHQVEGGNENDWTDWETSAKRLADLERRGLLIKYGKENYVSGRAVGHYKLFEDDFKLAKELGHTAFRFSIEWSRIEPKEGVWNDAEISHYRARVQALRRLGIEPFLTLWHWPVPRWVRNGGGWENGKTACFFARYAEKVVRELPEVNFFITLNEPEVYTSMSYLQGAWPPQKKNPIAAWRVIRNLIKGHKLAYELIKKVLPGAQVGISKHNTFFEPHEGLFANKILANIYNWAWNRYVLNRIRDFQDFIGVNQYFHQRIHFGRNRNENKVISDMEWELYPEAIYHVLKELKRYGKPLYITENGLADATDKLRGWYIHEVLQWVHRAIQEGVDVRGYLHWSLLDNLEWDKGFWPRFGLVEVDYETLARKPRPSALLYADIARANAITPEIREKHAHLIKHPSQRGM